MMHRQIASLLSILKEYLPPDVFKQAYQTLDNFTPAHVAELSYPRSEGSKDSIRVDLVDVRAADALLISYDFERDGWVIKQASKFEWEDGEDPDPCWREAAFCPAWQFEPQEEDKL